MHRSTGGVVMYSKEIETFLKERNYEVTPEECNLLMDVNTNTQIKSMKYFWDDNKYHICTEDGYYFKFVVREKEN